MLNLATVLLVGVFFVVVTAANPTMFDAISTVNRISFVEKCVEKRINLIAQLIADARLLPSDEKYFGLIQELKQNMTEDSAGIRFMVDLMINDSSKTDFNKTYCKRFLDEYEKDIESVKDRLDHKIKSALNETIAILYNAVDECKEGLQSLRKLKDKAASCNGQKCMRIKLSADKELRRVLELTSELICADKKHATYVRMLLEMENGAFIEKGVAVVNNTEQCVRGGNLSIRNHF